MLIYNIQISVPLKLTNLDKVSPSLGDGIHSYWFFSFGAQGHFEFSKVMNTYI